MDAADEGEGWTCFGGSGLATTTLDDAPWIGAWAPGGKESVRTPGYGVKLRAGSRIIMQVHYNLLAGTSPDNSAAQLRLAPGSRDMEELHTMLLPGPVELPCREKYSDGPLCDRDAAIFDVMDRFGPEGSDRQCALPPVWRQARPATPVAIHQGMTRSAAGGHMHLLGRAIRIEVNPGTPRRRPSWTSRSGTSTTRVLEPSSRSRSPPGTP